jgi:hypothetical protein
MYVVFANFRFNHVLDRHPRPEQCTIFTKNATEIQSIY